VSGVFACPGYQKGAGVPASLNPAGYAGRGLPDVAGNADPDSGYNILVDGESMPVGGTSAVAPLWAGLIARMNQKLGRRVGFINPKIYSFAANSGAFHDVTDGDNRCTFKTFHNVGYESRQGWDACSGLGSPDGVTLCGLLKVLPTDLRTTSSARRVRPRRRTVQATVGL
jgi:kumamolisin